MTGQHGSGERDAAPHGGRAVVTGRRCEAGLYDAGMATYDTGDTVGPSRAQELVQHG